MNQEKAAAIEYRHQALLESLGVEVINGDDRYETAYADGFRGGFDAGISFATRWTAIDGKVENLPSANSNWLVTWDGPSGPTVEEARFTEDGKWQAERTDGYNEPIFLDAEGTVTAYRPLPEPYTPNGETKGNYILDSLT